MVEWIQSTNSRHEDCGTPLLKKKYRVNNWDLRFFCPTCVRELGYCEVDRRIGFPNRNEEFWKNYSPEKNPNCPVPNAGDIVLYHQGAFNVLIRLPPRDKPLTEYICSNDDCEYHGRKVYKMDETITTCECGFMLQKNLFGEKK
jgi:hypothetical protein